MVTCTATQNVLCTDYINLGSWVGLATGAPGTTSSPQNEALGGSPAYQRVATTWGSVSGGSSTGSAVTINVSAATYTYMLLASNSSGANQVDNCSISSVVMGAQGAIVVTPTFSQT